MPLAGSDVQQSTRRLFVWFLLTTIVPAVALAWLGWMLVEQDRRSQREARRTARDQAVELAAAALQRRLAELEEQLSTFGLGENAAPDNMGADVAAVTFTRDALVARAGLSLPFHSVETRGVAPKIDALDEADTLEFAAEDHVGALRLVEPVVRWNDPRARGEALLRLARLSRKLGRVDDALAAYRRLGALGQTIVAGQPAGLAAAQGQALLLEVAGRRAELAEVATTLLRALDDGRWPLERRRYTFAREQAARWLKTAASAEARRPVAGPDADRVALSVAADHVWNEWQRGGATTAARGRATSWADDRSVLVLRGPRRPSRARLGSCWRRSA
jgi:tetratricopeptide (TPR) repeat protein